MGELDNFLQAIGSVAIGIVGGKVILSLLKEGCRFCGFISSLDQETCPSCLRKKRFGK